eukprot:754068-Hanusia_phi.AAC.3
MSNRAEYDLNSSIETSAASVRRGQAFLKTLAEAESALSRSHTASSVGFRLLPAKKAQRQLDLEVQDEPLLNSTVASSISEFSSASHLNNIDRKFQRSGLSNVSYDKENELRRELKKKDGEIQHARIFNKTLQEHLATNETNLEMLQRNLEKVAQKDRESASKILQLEGYIHSRDTQYSELQAKYQTLKTCFDEMMEGASSNQHDLQAKVASEVKKNSDLSDRMGKLQNEIHELKGKEAALEQERDELYRQIEEVTAKMTELDQTCSEERQKLQRKERELTECKEYLNTLRASCESQSFKLQYHDEVEMTLSGRIEELKEALRSQEQDLKDSQTEHQTATRRIFHSFDVFVIRNVEKIRTSYFSHLLFALWALRAQLRVVRMRQVLRNLEDKVCAHDVKRISFHAMRPVRRASLLDKIVAKTEEKARIQKAFLEWGSQVKNAKVMTRIGLAFISYSLQFIFQGWKRVWKTKRLSQSALSTKERQFLQYAFCHMKHVVLKLNTFR